MKQRKEGKGKRGTEELRKKTEERREGGEKEGSKEKTKGRGKTGRKGGWQKREGRRVPRNEAN